MISFKYDLLKNERYIISWLFCLALIVRIAGVFIFCTNGELSTDEMEHYVVAKNIVNGAGYAMVPQQSRDFLPQPTAYRTPGAILLMALAMKLFGCNVMVVRALVIIISSMSSPLMYLLTRNIADHRTSALAGVICAIYPAWVYYSLFIFSEPFFVPGLLLSIIVSIGAVRNKSFTSSLCAGFAWGMTTLIKPLGFPMMVLFIIYFSVTSGLRQWRLAAVVLAGFFIVLAPWVVRNKITMKDFIFLATEGGETFLGANNPYVADNPELYGMWVSPMQIREYREKLEPVRDEVERSRMQSNIAMKYLKEHPEKIPELVLRKEIRLFTPFARSKGIAAIVILVSYGSLLALVIIGAVRKVYRSTPALHLAMLWLVTVIIVTAVYWGNLTRGRLPVEIVFIPWGVISLVSILKTMELKNIF